MKVFYFNSIAMDDKKKYNKALERARVYRDNARAVGDYATVARYENIFPELRESEDEKIRKEIVNFLETISIGELKRVPRPISQWFFWLEKQKEPKLAPYDLQKSFEAGQTSIVDNPEQYGLCKKAEWSEEDESELTAIIYCVSQAIKASKDENERNSLLSAKKWLQDKLSFRVKSLRPSWKPNEEQIDALKELIDDANRAGWVTPGATELYEQLKKL